MTRDVLDIGPDLSFDLESPSHPEVCDLFSSFFSTLRLWVLAGIKAPSMCVPVEYLPTRAHFTVSHESRPTAAESDELRAVVDHRGSRGDGFYVVSRRRSAWPPPRKQSRACEFFIGVEASRPPASSASPVTQQNSKGLEAPYSASCSWETKSVYWKRNVEKLPSVFNIFTIAWFYYVRAKSSWRLVPNNQLQITE